MRILENYDLTKLNTFGISVNAKFFVEIKEEGDLLELFSLPEFKNNKKIFLGGRSNILFTKDFDGIVVLNKLKGIEILEAPTKIKVPTGVGNDDVYIRAMGGEIWHNLVDFAATQGYWGIENLAFIPGTVGAAPIQNIGAYGAEIKDTILSVEAFDLETGAENKKKIFSKEDCGLGYRDSVFKNKLKGKYFISAITLKLSKMPKPNLSYKILSGYLEKNKIEIKNPKNISDAVTSIRKSKLPDPKILGNAGSFFKNVFVTKKQLQTLQLNYPEIPYFEESEIIKVPSGWLIEQCGWRGHRAGDVGAYEKQALVLVNYGGANGEEIVNLANAIIKSVKEKFGLELIPEVNIV